MSYFISGQCEACKYGFPICSCKYIKDVDLESYMVEWCTDIQEATDFSESASYTLTMMGYKKSEYAPSITEKIDYKPRYMGIIIREFP